MFPSEGLRLTAYPSPQKALQRLNTSLGLDLFTQIDALNTGWTSLRAPLCTSTRPCSHLRALPPEVPTPVRPAGAYPTWIARVHVTSISQGLVRVITSQF